jgi:hypothetical protein
MPIELKQEKLSKKAENIIGSMKIEYNFDHLPGVAPDIIRARGQFEGTDTVLDATYAPETQNFNTVFHYLQEKTDVSIVKKILADMVELAKI